MRNFVYEGGFFMDKLTEFLVKCRMTRMVSNYDLLMIVKISTQNQNFQAEALKYFQQKLRFDKYKQFLLLLSSVNIYGIQALSFLDDFYPEQLRNIYDPPALLFYKGNKNLLLTSCLAIVGSRNATEYSYRCVHGLVPKICHRYTVVSGLAQGVDALAHQATLKNFGQTIAVVGNGLDVCYPSQNSSLQQEIAQRGLLISEYPPGDRAHRWHFPQRNRIIAGLCEKVVITEARKKSGALITARFAVESNRDVYAVPGRIDAPLSVGCNQLVQEGAIPLINFNEI